MVRYGAVIRIKPEHLMEYRQMHAHPWPEVNAAFKMSGITNYSVFQKDDLLFTYFEYEGMDFEADLKRAGENPHVQRWCAICDAFQQPLETRAKGEWWARMEQIYYLE